VNETRGVGRGTRKETICQSLFAIRCRFGSAGASPSRCPPLQHHGQRLKLGRQRGEDNEGVAGGN
jgi:hypothetical protein